jgi:hypothetical protein
MIRYAELLNNDAPLLLGVRLRPFSLGHVIHLQNEKSLFVNPSYTAILPPVDISSSEKLAYLQNIMMELMKAICICAFTFEEFNQLKEGTLYVDDEKCYIDLFDYMARWNLVIEQLNKTNTINLMQTLYLFNEYLKDGYQMPGETEQVGETNGEPVTKDWITVLVESLVSESRTETQLLNQPLKLTFLQYCMLGERNGQIRFMPQDEIELRNMAINNH